MSYIDPYMWEDRIVDIFYFVSLKPFFLRHESFSKIALADQSSMHTFFFFTSQQLNVGLLLNWKGSSVYSLSIDFIDSHLVHG